MKLQINRPICFLDIESTGLNRDTDRIVEISIIKYNNGISFTKTRRVNPIIPIPKEATEIHGISNSDVENEPTFQQLATGILSFISCCDMAGFGSNNYDIPLLYNEFLRCGIEWNYHAVNFIDVGNIFKIQNPRDLTAAYKTYCDKEHDGAHGAEADTKATMEVFFAQIEKHDLPATVEELAKYSNYDRKVLDLSGKFTYNENGEIIFTFGPKRGLPAKYNLDFVEWMYNRDFAPDTKAICLQLLYKDPNNNLDHEF